MTTIDSQLFNQLRFWSDSPGVLASFDPTDAMLDREDSLSERQAFALGVEMGTHRLDGRTGEGGQARWPCSAMEQGYSHGLKQAARRSDVYLRKLLNLKVNAYARGIPVSSALSVEFLRSITVTTCPVSGVSLTQGTHANTDWSLDRLNNRLGYMPGNVCFLSARVNTLKGEGCFETVADEAQTILLREGPRGFASTMPNGLRVLEGLRLAALMAAPAALGQGQLGHYTPFAMAPLAWSTLDAVVAGIHIACARTRLEGRAYANRKNHFKRLGNQTWRASNRLVETIRSALGLGAHPADIWFDADALEDLRTVTAAFLANPPDCAHVEPEALARSMREGLSPIRQYAR